MHKNAKLTPAGRALLVKRVREDGLAKDAIMERIAGPVFVTP